MHVWAFMMYMYMSGWAIYIYIYRERDREFSSVYSTILMLLYELTQYSNVSQDRVSAVHTVLTQRSLSSVTGVGGR